jgi:hypothetical protein
MVGQTFLSALKSPSETWNRLPKRASEGGRQTASPLKQNFGEIAAAYDVAIV